MRLGICTLALCAMIFTACSSTHLKRERVSRSDSLHLYLEHHVSKGEIIDEGYAHPYTFHTYELKEIFKGLTYREPRLFKDPVEQNVFFPDEALHLAEEIAKTLGSARSYQRIRFTSYNFGEGTIFSKKRKTEGVIFLKPAGELNIAFLVINEKPPLDPIDGTVKDEEFLKTTKENPMKITFSKTPLVPKVWYMLKPAEEAGKIHPLWAVVKLDMVRVLYQDKLRAEVAEPVKEAVEPAPAVKEADDVKQQLQRLKEFYDEGLIDEGEYKEKKKQLLEKVIS